MQRLFLLLQSLNFENGALLKKKKGLPRCAATQ